VPEFSIAQNGCFVKYFRAVFRANLQVSLILHRNGHKRTGIAAYHGSSQPLPVKAYHRFGGFPCSGDGIMRSGMMMS
jgi:hypothetical protein